MPGPGAQTCLTRALIVLVLVVFATLILAAPRLSAASSARSAPGPASFDEVSIPRLALGTAVALPVGEISWAGLDVRGGMPDLSRARVSQPVRAEGAWRLALDASPDGKSGRGSCSIFRRACRPCREVMGARCASRDRLSSRP